MPLKTIEQQNAEFIKNNPQYSYSVPSPYVAPKAPGSAEAAALQQKLDMEKYFPKSPVSTINTNNAVTNLNNQNSYLNTTYPQTATPNVDTKPTETKVEPKAYFANDMGQEAEFTQAQLDDAKNTGFLTSGGYTQVRTEGPNFDTGRVSGLRDDVASVDKEIQDAITSLKTYNPSNDPDFIQYQTNLEANLKRTSDLVKQAGENTAQSLVTALGGRMRSGGAIKLRGNILQDAQLKIGDLNLKEQDALLQARIAFKDKKYSEFNTLVNSLRETRKDKADALQDYNKSITEYNKELRKAVADKIEREAKVQEKLTSDINGILSDVGKTGAPEEVINAISRSTSVAEAVKAAGDYLQAGTGIVGEYNYYKKDAVSRGLQPLSFDEYQTKDTNRKVSIAKAAVDGTGLDFRQQAVFNRIVDKYNASPAIKALDRANMLKNILAEAEKNPTSAGAQLNLLYSYIKGLDTDSAVREGELDLVKSVSDYVSKYQMSFNKIQNSQAVSTGTLKEMITGGKNLVSSIEDTAKRKKKVFDAQAKSNGTQVYSAWQQFDTDISSIGNTSDEITSNQEEAKNKVIEYGKVNPQLQQEMRNLLIEIQDDIGRPYTYDEVAQIYNL